MSVLRELAWRAAQAPGEGTARLECGCLMRPARLIPCVWHRREVEADLRALTEDEAEHEPGGACCDPA